MKKTTTLFIAFIVLSGMAQAHNINGPFYRVHRIFEDVEYFVASISPLHEQAFISVRNANRRTDEIKQTNASEVIESLEDDFKSEVNRTEERFNVINVPNRVRVRSLVQQAREKHLTVLESLLTKLPPQAKSRIETNIQRHRERISLFRNWTMPVFNNTNTTGV